MSRVQASALEDSLRKMEKKSKELETIVKKQKELIHVLNRQKVSQINRNSVIISNLFQTSSILWLPTNC